MLKNLEASIFARYALILVALSVLSSCDGSLAYETGPTATWYFRKGSSDDLRKCPPKRGENWHVSEFEFEGRHHEFVAPLGLICVQGDSGNYIGTYVSAASRGATHQLEEGRSKNFISRGAVFKTRTR